MNFSVHVNGRLSVHTGLGSTFMVTLICLLRFRIRGNVAVRLTVVHHHKIADILPIKAI